MQEIFCEETVKLLDEASAKRKYTTFNIISIIFYVLTFFWFLFFFNFVSCYVEVNGVEKFNLFEIIFSWLIFLILLATGFLFTILKNKSYVEYDYTFVSGSIRIAKVIKNIKRRLVLKFETVNIEKIGRVNSATYNKYCLISGIKKKVLTQNAYAEKDKGFYYIVANVNGDKYLLVLECTLLFITNVLKYSYKYVLEEEFNK